jgi:hypothetical protein
MLCMWNSLVAIIVEQTNRFETYWTSPPEPQLH